MTSCLPPLPRALVLGLAALTAVGTVPALATSAAASGAPTTYLSDLPTVSEVNGWGPMERDRSNGERAAGDGAAIRIGGVTFARGLGVHAGSDVRIVVPAGCTSFAATAGVDDSVGRSGSVVFRAFLGSVRVYDSGRRTGASLNVKPGFAVTPGSTLRLVVTDAGDGKARDHADWADARLICTATAPAPTTPTPTGPATTPVALSDLPFLAAVGGWGPVERDRSNGGQSAGDGGPLSVDGRTYAKGLGVHAVSDVLYTVPAGCTTFMSTVGVDDSRGTAGSVVFRVFQHTSQLWSSATLTGASPAQQVAVPVAPGTVLRLAVTDAGDGNANDHADWADARLLCASATPTPAAPAAVPVTLFGAVGDGVADDTAAVQRALDAVQPGGTVQFPAGRTFRHTDVLTARVPGARITGGGTLLATQEARSAVYVDADRVRVDHLTFRMGATTQRWGAYEQMKLRLGGRAGIHVEDVTIDGSASAGVYVGASTGFTLRDVTVRDSRSDGIHMTEGASDGLLVRPVVHRSGDDGVAVVSYATNPNPSRRIRVESPRVYDNLWGRGLTVVGGEDVTYTDVHVERSSSAALYLASEGNWNTHATKRVTVTGGTLVGSNTAASVDHGAVLVFNGRPGYVNEDITVTGLTVRDTRATASRQVAIISDSPDAINRRIHLSSFAITGGPNPFWANAPSTSYNLVGWTWNGSPRADRIGWTP